MFVGESVQALNKYASMNTKIDRCDWKQEVKYLEYKEVGFEFLGT